MKNHTFAESKATMIRKIDIGQSFTLCTRADEIEMKDS
jgi:hypothetical protein